MNHICTAPITATRALAHHARPVKPISVPALYKKPETRGAIVRAAAPEEAASPFILPKTESEGLACLISISNTGKAIIESILRTARQL